MAMSCIYIEEIVKNITNTNTISVEIIDYLKNIYDKILFYDEFDEVMPNSKEYSDEHREYYWNEVKNYMTSSHIEFKHIPKFKLKGRKSESVIEELALFIVELANERV